jgi:hypothetical protein
MATVMALLTFLLAQAQAAALMLKLSASLLWICCLNSTAVNKPTQVASSWANFLVTFKQSFPIHLTEVGGVFFLTLIIQIQETHGSQSMGFYLYFFIHFFPPTPNPLPSGKRALSLR